VEHDYTTIGVAGASDCCYQNCVCEKWYPCCSTEWNNICVGVALDFCSFCNTTAPVGSLDEFNATEDIELVVPAPGVLANDFDVDGDIMTVVLVDYPIWGDVELYPNGSFTYTPYPDDFGPDQFTYVVRMFGHFSLL
jgi:hypothetical protein